MQEASSSVRALCVSPPAGSNGWPIRAAARRVIRHSAYAHATSSSSCLARASGGPGWLARLTNQSSAKYS